MRDKIIQKIKRWYIRRQSFISVDEMFYNADMQEGSYKPNRNYINVGLGVVCIVVGVATWYIPFTTIPLCSLGLFLIGCPISIRSLLKRVYRDIKFYLGVLL